MKTNKETISNGKATIENEKDLIEERPKIDFVSFKESSSVSQP